MADINYAFIINYIIQTRDYIKEFVENELKYDEEIDSWLFVSEPWPMLIIIVVYLLFALKIGPKMMENRLPYDVSRIILVFNFLQFSYNTMLCLWIILTPGIPQYIFTQLCHIRSEIHNEKYLVKCLHTVSWFYYMSNIIGLLDTNVVIRTGEHAAYGAVLNSSVLIVMNGYYFLAALGPYMQKYLWWKVYVTRLQIFQLFIAVAYKAYLYKYDCATPSSLALNAIIDLIALIYLFVVLYGAASADDKTFKSVDRPSAADQTAGSNPIQSS